MSIEQRYQLDQREEGFDRVIQWLLIAMLAFAPLAFGVVEAWSEEIVLALTAIISVCFLVKMITVRGASLTWTWAYLPVAVFIAVAISQLIPLPATCVRLLSPNNVEEKMRLLGSLGGSDPLRSSMMISFYPHATWHDLRLVLAVAVVFVVVLNTVRRPDQIIRLLGAIAVIGAAVALLALAQDVFGNDKIYWRVTSPHGTARSGPFVNHSHYAQFMNLSMGAALGVILVKIHQRFAHRRAAPADVAEYLGSSDAKRVVWPLIVMVIAGVATVFASLSRGGMISLLIAGAFTTLLLSSRRSVRGTSWIMAVIALAAFICVLYVGFDAVYDRLGTLSDLNRAEGGRWQMLKDVAVAWTRFPVMGTGLGTHEVVYPMFDRSTAAAVASHAENEYAQAAEETGAVGLLALVVFGLLVWASFARIIRTSRTPVHSAAYGLGFGLMAIMLHSLSDFGQHLPANAFLSAIFCALLVRLPRIDPGRPETGGEIATVSRRTHVFGTITLAVACAVFGWALIDANAARRGQAHWALALRAERDLMEGDWQGSDDEYAYLLSCAMRAKECEPGNVKYSHWLNVYRWRAISRVTDPNTGEVVLHPQSLEFVDRIAEELKQAVTLCPTYGAVWCVLGQLEKFVLGRHEEGVRHIRTGRRLAPCDPTACFVAGLLCAEEGDADAAFGEWQRAVELDGRLFVQVASSFVQTLDRADFAYQLAADNTSWLIRLESLLGESSGNAKLLEETSNRLLELLDRECQEVDAPAWKFAWLAHRHYSDGRTNEAIDMYRRALALEYGRVTWRCRLAELFAEQGSVAEAIREAEICLRLSPGLRAAERLIARLSVAQTSESDGH